MCYIQEEKTNPWDKYIEPWIHTFSFSFAEWNLLYFSSIWFISSIWPLCNFGLWSQRLVISYPHPQGSCMPNLHLTFCRKELSCKPGNFLKLFILGFRVLFYYEANGVLVGLAHAFGVLPNSHGFKFSWYPCVSFPPSSFLTLTATKKSNCLFFWGSFSHVCFDFYSLGILELARQ